MDGDSRESALDAQTGTQVVLRRISGGTQNSAGVFAQDVITPVPRVSLTLALRHNRWSNVDGHNFETDAAGAPAAGNRPQLADRSDGFISPRAAVHWDHSGPLQRARSGALSADRRIC